MADKTYTLKFEMSDGSVKTVRFTVPQADTSALEAEIASLKERVAALESGSDTGGTEETPQLDTPVIEVEGAEEDNGETASGHTLTIEHNGAFDDGYGLIINGESQSVGTGTWENVSMVEFRTHGDYISVDVKSGTFPSVIENDDTITLVDDVVINDIYK